MTAAQNEEALIERTITSVLGQSLRPDRWVIVSDNSNDRTDEIVRHYVLQNSFMRLLQVGRPSGRSFRSKVIALRQCASLLENVSFDFIGNVDADVSIEPTYFEDLMDRFEQDSRLGLASGFVCEERNGEFRNRTSNRIDSVPHAAQLLRRECYEAIGGYAVLPHGGEDWYAQTRAQMGGWKIEAFPELPIFHYRHTGRSSNLMGDRFRLGRLDYSLGSDPLFEIVKCLVRLPERPRVVGAFTRLAGFGWSFVHRDPRPVSADFVAFLRGEQRAKFSALFHGRGRRGIMKMRKAGEG